MEQSQDQGTCGPAVAVVLHSGRNTQPAQISQMLLVSERQAVQAVQQKAVQYFQQLMLQQQINGAQPHNLTAMQQATLAASQQSSCPYSSVSAVSPAECRAVQQKAVQYFQQLMLQQQINGAQPHNLTAMQQMQNEPTRELTFNNCIPPAGFNVDEDRWEF